MTFIVPPYTAVSFIRIMKAKTGPEREGETKRNPALGLTPGLEQERSSCKGRTIKLVAGAK
jgi:hypothetical protein